MGFQDAVNYVLFTNPISSSAGYLASSTWHATGKAGSALVNVAGLQSKQPTMANVPLWKLASAAGPYVRLAAISGASAVILGAYGAHKKYTSDQASDLKPIFETASKYHFFHTFALLALPLCRAPGVAATFFISGLLLFCGSCYYCSFTGDKSYNHITPFGGVCFIIGWLSMLI